ncbi:MAG: hypothetical protein WD040_02260 [Anaerolineales bacterium]
MPASRGFALTFAPEVIQDLRAFARKDHGLIRRELRARLRNEPDKETKNRKRLDVPAPLGAQWELRFGRRNRTRAFYEVDADARIVMILAIGVKEGNTLRLGREEFQT